MRWLSQQVLTSLSHTGTLKPTLGFSSLRQQIETETETWLNNSTISMNDYPEDNYGVEGSTAQTLFNQSSEVKIGSNIYSLTEYPTVSGPVSTPPSSDPCFYRGRKTSETDFNSNSNKKAILKLVVDGDSGWLQGARYKGKSITFKKSGSRWKKYATGMSVRLYGDIYQYYNNCALGNSFDDSNSSKRRYHRKLKYTMAFGDFKLGTKKGHFTGEFTINGDTKTLGM